ncbi:Polycystic kidney disease protein 1-like 2 PC1-like 2 protein [Collichthys lucidus]|uniref:Polycystic kidney disease protein 1-like 2 PC1-like 2 protein n=1 Tax=Collichthys lucidus TaxID=240159 RepID=A0A4U5U3R8_COLLU|nr:Polycystic kidney disease protein 1-like 2 PC1-like 2 protein [Collichthys lucidus]
MCQIYLHLLFLVTLSCPFCAENTTKITVLCPEEQKAFRGSCYEFVSLQRNFSGAQAWCEQRGGHLAFIPDEDTQYFLQRHLDPKKDMWFGAAPSTDLQIPPNVEGPLIWLNGSYITYSNWVSSPQPGAACGHMLRDSGFQWEATIHCNREMAFICQIESGRSIVCAGRNTTLQCGSGQVLMIDGGFYGRENNYYCRSTLSPPTTHKQYQCSWVDVVEPLTAQCHGRSVCNITEVMESFGEPCPQLGSYLSLDYHCNDGLTLSVSIVAAVFDNIAISVKWLLHLPEGNPQCNLSPGDGLVINLHSLEGLESSMVHKYTHPGTFVVAVECTSRDIHITAQKIITIQEPIRQFGVIRCYAGKLSFHRTNCRAYYEEQFQIQMEVKAGTNVTYRIQHGGTVLSGLSVVRGNIPQNVTVTPEMVKLLGPGCHQLTLYASNMVTFPEVAADLQMCVLEKVAGLQASVLTERDDCLDSPDITVGVSLKGGAPVLLLFTLTGENISFSETRKMKTRKEIFRIGLEIQGSVQVKLRAWNIFSSLEVDVDMFGSCGKDSALKQRKKHVRVVRSSLKITATPSASVNDKNEVIVLTINQDLKDPKKHYQWSCRDDTPLYKKHTIKTSSSPDKPDPTTKSPVTKDPSNPSNPATPSSSSSATGSSSSGLTCTISPQSGTIFDVFKIICNTGTPCSKCQYCFKTDDGQHLRCSKDNVLESVFLPLGDSSSNHRLIIKATAKDKSFVAHTTITAQVLDYTDNSNSSVDGLKIVVEAAVARMNKLGILSGETLGQMFHSVGNNLNGQSDKNTKQKRQKLREQLLDTMIETVNEVPTKAPEEVQVASRGLSAVILKGTELSSSAQEEASLFFANISLSLLHMQVNDSGEIQLAASSIVEATSNILDYSSSKNISDALLLALHHTQSALLTFKGDNEEPIVIQKAHIGMLVNRVAPGSMQTKPINLPNNSSSSFFLPKLPSNILSHRTVDVRMLSLDKNPFSWNDQGNISGLVGALSLTRKDGSDIPVENLTATMATTAYTMFLVRQFLFIFCFTRSTCDECDVQNYTRKSSLKKRWSGQQHINSSLPSQRHFKELMFSAMIVTCNASEEMLTHPTLYPEHPRCAAGSALKNPSILMPRPVGEEVTTTVLELSNYSTTVLNISSAYTTLVLKMMPSKDPLPFKLFLGYMDYPTDTNYIVMTKMPHQGATQEERYTWLVEPEKLKGNTGEHYLLVRPIVGPGIKSIKANLSITSINTACQFWNTTTLDWNSHGCRVGVNTTDFLTQCLCNHLTFFGSSFFVTPNLVDPSRTAELFATFAENPVVVCFVGALFVVYLLVVVWARRKDVNDVAKVKVTVLEDNDPIDDYCYLLSISTGYRRGASTSSQVTITLLGSEGNSEPHHLTDSKKCVFERGAVDMFLLTAPYSMGDLQGIRLWHNNSGSHPDWYVGNVMVQDLQTEQKWHFLCNSWLAIDMGDCSLDKVFSVSTEMDLKRFSNLFFMKTTKDFHDGHLWYSVISRPPSSTFTCVQRVSCCFSLLLCTMLTSIMFYGIPADPSEQTMDLGQFEFTWQQFMIGVQSSLIMFPVNILIVSVFRNTRPWETACCKRKTEKPDALEQTSSPKSATNNINVNVTLETVIKDITRIAHSLSKTVKSNIPCTEPEFGPGQQVDINTVLSVVEDFIKHKNKSNDTAQTKTQSLHNLVQPQLPEGSASKHPGSPVEAIQKKSNKTQYLYRQLCHIDKELNQLGPSGFPTPHSYSQALQQVQGMKGFLEDQLFTFSCVDQDEVTQKKISPTDSTDGRDRQKKRACCHGGLPWWFIFVGWLLVIATSCVAGYFTMLYGLKFGKQRSISWLVSMIISFFQSILITQPLKVLCLAVFFALVIKKVDEDFQNVVTVPNNNNQGDCKVQRTTRENNSVYEPPAPTDVEKMRRKKILEQKAFALLREILTYMGFMWMLLLVAYSERDPNAFFLNQHIRNSFSEQISDSMNLGDVFIWAKTSLLNNLFGVYPGFITDGNSKLVGNARLRQLRVQKNSCQIAGSMLQLIPDCHAPYSWEVEDMGSYDPGWNHSARDNNYTSTSSPWEYQTQSQLRAYPVWGTIALYRGGGFLTELGPDLQNANSILEHLFRNKWLDMYTRAIFVEFTVYNANVNLFCIVTLLLESTGVGAFQFSSDLQSVRLYPSTGGLYIFVMIAEIIYLLFILYYMFLQGKLMKQQRWAYFRSKWNLLELTIILLTWSAVAVFIQRTLLGNRDMTYYQNHKDQFPSFYETAQADSLLQYLIAFLVLLSTIKLWHLLRLNPKMNMITATLQRAWSDICSFLVVIVIMLVAYSIASNVIYGWKISSYKTLADALVTIISLQIGIFNYDEVLNGTPLLGGLLFGSCIVFMTFVVLNLLISVILVAFNQEQIYHKPSDEEEIVDLMLMKICNLFGIKYKNTKDTPGSDVKGASDLTLNNGKNIINSSSADADIFSTDSSILRNPAGTSNLQVTPVHLWRLLSRTTCPTVNFLLYQVNKEFLDCAAEGADVRVPSLSPKWQEEEWKCVGRILTKGLKDQGYFPFFIYGEHVLPDLLFDSLMLYLTQSERDLLSTALQEAVVGNDKEELLDHMDRMGVRTVPTPDNLRAMLVQVAHKQMIQHPKYALDNIAEVAGPILRKFFQDTGYEEAL